MHKARENIFSELTNEMHFEDMIGNHTDYRYSYSYRLKLSKVLEKKLDADTS